MTRLLSGFIAVVCMVFSAHAQAAHPYGEEVTLTPLSWAKFPHISLHIDEPDARGAIKLSYMFNGIKYETAPFVMWRAHPSAPPITLSFREHDFTIELGYSAHLKHALGEHVIVVLSSEPGLAPRASYNRITSFGDDRTLHFPDFTLQYLGTRKTTPKPPINRSFTYHQFEVKDASGTQMVEWSSGMGEISPQAFTVGGKRFLLELASSSLPSRYNDGRIRVATPLNPNQLVILTPEQHQENHAHSQAH